MIYETKVLEKEGLHTKCEVPSFSSYIDSNKIFKSSCPLTGFKELPVSSL